MVSDTAKSYKYLRWVKEFNFNPVPTRLSFRTILDRNYNELEYRNVDALLSGNAGQDFDVIRNRNFFFGWQYSLGFNFTKSLKLEINSETKTLNDNLDVNAMNNRSIFSNPFRAGRPVLYITELSLATDCRLNICLILILSPQNLAISSNITGTLGLLLQGMLNITEE